MFTMQISMTTLQIHIYNCEIPLFKAPGAQISVNKTRTNLMVCALSTVMQIEHEPKPGHVGMVFQN